MGWNALGTLVLVAAVLAVYARGGFRTFARNPRTDLLVLLVMAIALAALWVS